jgi:hypothetical protein
MQQESYDKLPARFRSEVTFPLWKAVRSNTRNKYCKLLLAPDARDDKIDELRLQFLRGPAAAAKESRKLTRGPGGSHKS